MRINDLIFNHRASTAKAGKARVIFQEEDPYDGYLALDGMLITDWYNTFIGKISTSFEDGRVSSMGSKEKTVFDAYTKVSIYTADDLNTQAVKNLDIYLSTITSVDLEPTVVVAY